MVATPVRVKPPPAETGEIISPTCASFGNGDAVERRANHAIVHGLLSFGDARFGAGHLHFGQRDFGFQTVDGSARVVQRFLALHASGLQSFRTMHFDLRVFELDFEIGDLCARGIAVGDGGFKRAPHIGIVERRQDLALLLRACLHRRRRR